MRITVPFTKASGAGNDFVLLNNVRGDFSLPYPAFARVVCDRHFGVGGDGLLVLEKSSRADYAMHYYNADGSWGGMCGNGGRCIARFACVEGIAARSHRFEALEHIYEAVVEETTVTLHMKDPSGFAPDVSLDVAGQKLSAAYLDTGSPHAVLVEQDLEKADVIGRGRIVRQHARFLPAGTNVNFIRKKGGASIELRTYERGVESETLACGTGSVASALVAASLFQMESPVTVHVRSGENLRVHFRGTAGQWSEVYLEGSAHLLFSGTLVFETDPPTILIPS